jgi:hypothetical protein
MTATGFETFTAKNLSLVARQTLRVDATLQVGQTSQVVTVEGSEEGVIATDSQVIQETFDPKNLPVTSAPTRTQAPTISSRLCPVCRPMIATTSQFRVASNRKRNIPWMAFRLRT